MRGGEGDYIEWKWREKKEEKKKKRARGGGGEVGAQSTKDLTVGGYVRVGYYSNVGFRNTWHVGYLEIRYITRILHIII